MGQINFPTVSSGRRGRREQMKVAIETENIEAIRATVSTLNRTGEEMQEYVNQVLKTGNKEMLNVLFEAGASKELAVEHALEMGRIKSINMLLEMGLKVDLLYAIKTVVRGETGGPKTIAWLLERGTEPIERCEFEKIIQYARKRGLDNTASYMRKYLESSESRFSTIERK